MKSRRTHSSMRVVELVPDDDADPLEGLLCAEPGRHARVYDDGDAPLLPLIQSQAFLYNKIYENPGIEPTVFHIISFILGPIIAHAWIVKPRQVPLVIIISLSFGSEKRIKFFGNTYQ